MLKPTERKTIRGVVGVQPTFMPGGALPGPDGEAVIPAINGLLASRFAPAFATQDWHPERHTCFASAHSPHAPFATIEMPYGTQTLWPDHTPLIPAAYETV